MKKNEFAEFKLTVKNFPQIVSLTMDGKELCGSGLRSIDFHIEAKKVPLLTLSFEAWNIEIISESELKINNDLVMPPIVHKQIIGQLPTAEADELEQ